jgi:archaellum component FlaG (FlaF/FlaG flagellin family)
MMRTSFIAALVAAASAVKIMTKQGMIMNMLSVDISDMCHPEIPRELAIEFYKYGAAEQLDK